MKKAIFVSLLVLSFSDSLSAQKSKKPKQKISYDSSLYNSISYRLIGPLEEEEQGQSLEYSMTQKHTTWELLVEGFGKLSMREIHGKVSAMVFLVVR
jgi:hypothetical protein